MQRLLHTPNTLNPTDDQEHWDASIDLEMMLRLFLQAQSHLEAAQSNQLDLQTIKQLRLQM